MHMYRCRYPTVCVLWISYQPLFVIHRHLQAQARPEHTKINDTNDDNNSDNNNSSSNGHNRNMSEAVIRFAVKYAILSVTGVTSTMSAALILTIRSQIRHAKWDPLPLYLLDMTVSSTCLLLIRKQYNQVYMYMCSRASDCCVSSIVPRIGEQVQQHGKQVPSNSSNGVVSELQP